MERTFRNSIAELFSVVGVISTNSHDLRLSLCSRTGGRKLTFRPVLAKLDMMICTTGRLTFGLGTLVEVVEVGVRPCRTKPTGPKIMGVALVGSMVAHPLS
jgi:hypothetical protein